MALPRCSSRVGGSLSMILKSAFGNAAMSPGARLKRRLLKFRPRLKIREHRWWCGRIVTSTTKAQISCSNSQDPTGTFPSGGLYWVRDLIVSLKRSKSSGTNLPTQLSLTSIQLAAHTNPFLDLQIGFVPRPDMNSSVFRSLRRCLLAACPGCQRDCRIGNFFRLRPVDFHRQRRQKIQLR